MREADIQALCMIAASKMGAVVWRNNTGSYQIGDRYIRYGLCKGSSDIIGVYKGRFLALEVKKPKQKPSKDQLNFINIVNQNGGIAAVVFSPEDVKNVLSNIS